MHGSAEKAHKERAVQRGRNKVKFKNHHKQMKVLFMVFADFESLIRKIHGCAKIGHATINRCPRALWLFLHNREK